MCGGRGSRLKPLTENTPKPLVKILNKPVLDIIIEKVAESGIDEIYLSLGYMANEITDHCEKRDYGARLNYCYEDNPLGTAGGVKNCIACCDEDVLVLSGDNIFDIDLKKLYEFHSLTDSDFTVCGVNTDDPREYGVISCDDDNSIKGFIEKPTWEQAQGNLVNTGIYVFKGSILSKIPPETKYDFSDDLFPEMFSENLRFMCYVADGFWGDMGEFSAYRKITAAILDTGCRKFSFEGTFYGKDTLFENDVVIKAPCIIGKNTTLGKGTVVGPYCVLGRNCKIANNCSLIESVIGDNCEIGLNSDLNGCIADDCVTIGDNCSLETDTVIGCSSTIGRFSRVLGGHKVWPGRRVASETVVTRDMLYENPERIEFDIFGLSGKANSQISLDDIVMLGQAIASAAGIERVGIGSDSSYLSENFRSAIISGLRACGSVCYDFGEMFRAQAYFYSAYCNLDFFVFIDSSGDVVSLSFFGKNGMPVNSKIARNINNNYKFTAFSFAEPDKIKEVFNMKLFGVVYKSFFKKLCPLPLKRITVAVETDNPVIKSLVTDLFSTNSSAGDKKRNIQVLINSTASEIFVVENTKVYSGDRILSVLCELESAEGNEIIIPEESPSFIEDKLKKYGGKVTRVFENCSDMCNLNERAVLQSVWTFDVLLMVAKLLNVLEKADISLASLFEYQKSFALKKTVLDINGNSSDIKRLIVSCGARKNPGEIYYVFDGRIGKARLRQMGNSRKIRILAEADDMEAAKEISVFLTKKIKDANIDKENQK